jgi:hypothetical protein
MKEKIYQVLDSKNKVCNYVTNDGYLYRWAPKNNDGNRIIENFMMSTYENYPDINFIQEPCLFVFVSLPRATFFGKEFKIYNTLNLYRFKKEALEEQSDARLHIDKCDDGELYITWNDYSRLSSITINGHKIYKVLNLDYAEIVNINA